MNLFKDWLFDNVFVSIEFNIRIEFEFVFNTLPLETKSNVVLLNWGVVSKSLLYSKNLFKLFWSNNELNEFVVELNDE